MIEHKKIKTWLPRLLILSVAFSAFGCKEALDVESGAGLPSLLEPNNGVPTISVPSSATFYSNDSTLSIQGVCSENARVNLAGDDLQSTTCRNSTYSFEVTKNVDASYSFNISQIVGGVNSGAANLLWVRKSSVSNPTLTNPASSPYFSSDNLLSLTGTCESGATISLSGDASGSDLCENSTFSIDILKFVDGIYNISVTQTDQAGNMATIPLVWNRGALQVSPDDPQIVATNSQVFTITGGSGFYSVTFLDNQSGGTFDNVTLTYTAGTTAGVVDQIEVRDSQNFTEILNIQVLADAPDHFEFSPIDGNDQNTLIGTNLALPIAARVVDQYGNGVPNYSVLFQKTAGDVEFIDASVQQTDSNGDAYLNLRQGFTSFRSYITAMPLSGVLPDVVASGRTSLSFQMLSNNNNNGNFGLSFDVANGPDNQVIGDFNGDGNEDILVLNKGAGTVSVLSGSGNGLFTTLTPITGLCNGPSSMTSGHFNNDAFLDLIMSCSGSGEYSFIAGNGNGTFQSPVNTAISMNESFPVDVAAGDFNGDTFLDFVMTSAGTARVAVRTGNNDGTFNAPVLYVTGASPSRVVVGNVDNTNGQDFVVINAGVDTYRVFRNDGLGGFASDPDYTTGVAPASIALADINSNGFLDVLLVNNIDNNLSVYLNNLDGTFNLPINTGVGQSPVSIHVDEISGDTALDVVVANNSDSTLSVLHGFDNGTFDVRPVIATAANPINLGSGDLNNDGNRDIVAVSSGEALIQIFPSQSSGELDLISDVGNGPSKSIGGDFDEDGIRDKAVLNQSSGSISLLKGSGDGLFTQMAPDMTIGGSPIDGVAVDMNADGHLDLVTIDGSSNALRVILGNGDGSFGTPSNFATGLQPTALVTGDFNGDGNLDVVVSNSGPNSVSFYPGTGTGSFSGRTDTPSVGAQPSALASADFNGDGVLDVVVANQSASAIGVLMGNGNGSFQSPVSYAAQSGTNGVVTGYFNADNFIDIVASNSLASSVTVFIGQAGGAFATGVNYFSGFDPVGLSKGDLNGDNRDDLIVGNGLNQTATIMWGTLAGTFSTTDTVDTNVNSVGVEVDDLNGDGALDLTILDGTNGRQKVLLGH